MILSNFLSRENHNDSNPYMQNFLYARYCNIDEDSSGRYLVQIQVKGETFILIKFAFPDMLLLKSNENLRSIF